MILLIRHISTFRKEKLKKIFCRKCPPVDALCPLFFLSFLFSLRPIHCCSAFIDVRWDKSRSEKRQVFRRTNSPQRSCHFPSNFKSRSSTHLSLVFVLDHTNLSPGNHSIAVFDRRSSWDLACVWQDIKALFFASC